MDWRTTANKLFDELGRLDYHVETNIRPTRNPRFGWASVKTKNYGWIGLNIIEQTLHMYDVWRGRTTFDSPEKAAQALIKM